jgi:acetyl-CoA C-acetyltransferase/acetyl-CoA acyltransferase 2
METQPLWIVAAKRTAFGTFGGALKDKTATDLAVEASKAALAQSGVPPEAVGHVVFGNVSQTSVDAIYLARHVGLRAGLPEAVPALTVNRLCGSGFQSLVNGAQMLLLGEAEVVLVGGTESMSQAPHVLRGARWGYPFGKPGKLEDSLWDGLTDSYTGMPMAMTAEKLAERHRISREEADAFALRSQERWAQANEAGRFRDEIVALELQSRKGPVRFDTDEHPRKTSAETLAKLPPVFKKDGVVTAGNASGICDGAAALVLATRKAAERLKLAPLAQLDGWGIEGCDPTVMGIGPVPAIRALLARTSRTLESFDLVEVNEAFAPQTIAVERELGPGLDREKLNVNGGAIALGHPLGASGARITAHLCYELRRRKARTAIGSACIGGGQGIAVALSTVQ